MGKQKKYWKGLEELNNDADFQASKDKEFAEHLPTDEFLGDKEGLENSQSSRRDFLKFLGFSVTAASLAACETPVTKAIPYVIKPETITPGVPNWYATTFADGSDYCNILVKNREGRPIKIEGNKKSSITHGGVNARINSSVLSLYDSTRLQHPMMEGNSVSWETVDNAIIKELQAVADKGGNIRILTSSLMSPSTKKLINDFAEKFGGSVVDTGSEEGDSPSGANVKHITYDPVSYSGMINANKESFGKAEIPTYHFDKAKTIVSFEADFLSTWLSSVEYTAQYAKNRKPENDWMSRHFQFETNFSLTGTNADVRVPLKPSEQGKVILALHNYIASKTGGSSAGSVETDHQSKVAVAGDELLANKGESLVISGSNNKSVQVLVNGINNMLNNYGKTLDLENPSYIRQSDDKGVKDLVDEMNKGKVNALLVWGVDPSFTLPSSLGFSDALNKVKTTVSFASKANETSGNCKFVCPDNHYLESWNDTMIKPGSYALGQPVIKELYNTRQAQDSLLNWMGSNKDFHSYIQEYWEANVYPKSSGWEFFEEFWNNSLHDGVVEVNSNVSSEEDSEEDNNQEMSAGFNGNVSAAASEVKKAKGGDFELAFYQKTGIGDGRHADNPWLQELPDPVSKITWDNYLTMAPSDAQEFGFNTSYGEQKPASMAKVTVNGVSAAIPVIAQPGQTKGTVGLALGYGRKVGKMKEAVGVNAYPMLSMKGGELDYFAYDVSIENIDKEYPIATTQTHQTVMDRDGVVKETDLNTFKTKDREAYNEPVELATHEGKKHVNEIDLWEDHGVDKRGHRWGMVIDMNSCIGCGACVTSCSSENNVPVVGKDEVRRVREMHWIRIDRYFSSAEADKPDSEQSLSALEKPEENPKVVYQPMMCQHCNHAPCETVCPVAATTHSSEGLNMMTYNRCIGTRYCANNCPYKVRRFNWFNYNDYDKFTDVNPAQDDMGRMVLNPDVVVRSRGVMEKCSLCVQRIQGGKLEAKKEGRPVKDGEIQTACASACPTNAITFGDLNDSKTEVHKESQNKRSYRVIEEVGTQPNIYYQTKVRNEKTNEA